MAVDERRIAILGAGKIGEALVSGLLSSGWRSGDDLVAQTEGNDVLVGGAAGDTFNGKGGDDVIIGNGGNDTAIYAATWLQANVTATTVSSSRP